MKPRLGLAQEMSAIGQLLGDTLTGSCWRAYESAAAKPDIEARIYVRSMAEALVALDIVLAMAHGQRTLVVHDKEKATALAKETESFVAIELTNGSLVVLRPEAP